MAILALELLYNSHNSCYMDYLTLTFVPNVYKRIQVCIVKLIDPLILDIATNLSF